MSNQRQTECNVKLDRYTHLLPPGLCFMSVAVAFLHFLYDVTATHDPQTADHYYSGSMLLIGAAVAIPVRGAGVRTLRTAYEFTRNSNRFRAKHGALGHLTARLRIGNDPTALLAVMQ